MLGKFLSDLCRNVFDNEKLTDKEVASESKKENDEELTMYYAATIRSEYGSYVNLYNYDPILKGYIMICVKNSDDTLKDFLTDKPIILRSEVNSMLEENKFAELKHIPGRYLLVDSIRTMSKLEVAGALNRIKEHNMIESYCRKFNCELDKQASILREGIEKAEKEYLNNKYIEEHADEIIKSFKKRK